MLVELPQAERGYRSVRRISKNLAESYNVNADSSGDWSVSVSGNAEYAVSAQLAGYVYRNSVNVTVLNATVSAVNLKPVLVGTAN